MEFDLPDGVPEPEPADPHRPGIGWLFFVLVLIFAIGSQLPGYLNRKPEEKEAMVYREVGTSLRMGYLMSQSMRSLGPTSRPPVETEEIEKSLKPYLKAGEPQAAALWLATLQAAGKPTDQRYLPMLEGSKEPYFRGIAEVHRAETLSLERADQLAKVLSKGFSGRVTTVLAYKKAGVADPVGKVFSTFELNRPMIFALVAILALGLGVVLWVVYGALRAQGRLQPAGSPISNLSAADADRFAFKAGMMLLIPFAVPLVLASFVSKKSAGPAIELIYYVALGVATLGLAVAPVFGKGFSLRQIGWRRDRLLSDAGWGLAGAIANAPIIVIVAIVSRLAFQALPDPEHPATVELTSNPNLWTILITLFAASVAAPIVEETMFRGFLVPALGRITGGALGGAIVGGLAFAMVHPTGIPAWLPLAAVGAMAAGLNNQTGSLVSSVFMHAFHNTALLILTLTLFS